jgi:hypothetical protein
MSYVVQIIIMYFTWTLQLLQQPLLHLMTELPLDQSVVPKLWEYNKGKKLIVVQCTITQYAGLDGMDITFFKILLYSYYK